MHYIITNDSNGTLIQLTLGGETHFITDSRPELISALISGADEETVAGLIRSPERLPTYLKSLSERVSFDPNTNTVYFDGDVVNGVIAEALVRRYTEGFEDIDPVINFYEKLMQNPSEESREELFTFLEKHGLTLTANGNFLAYKGLNPDFTSIHKGKGIVNGEVIEDGYLDNTPGNVIEFPRSEVDDNRNNGCSVGLHAGSHEYANGFSRGALVLVEINPRDVVSVPTDSNNAKLRTCRYVVRSTVEKQLSGGFYNDDLTEDAVDSQREDFIEELVSVAAPYTRKGKVADSYVDIALALGYNSTTPEYFFAQTFDNAHTAQAVYRYHIEALV